MQPAATDSPPATSSRLARNLLLAFLAVSIAPLAALLSLIFIFSPDALRNLPIVNQQRLIAAVVILVMVTAGLAWWAASSFGKTPRLLLQKMKSFVNGNWEERSELSGGDEIGDMAGLFNRLADDMTELQHQLTVREIVHENEEVSSRQSVAAMIAQEAQTAASREDLLQKVLALYLRHYGCPFGAVYLVSTADPAGRFDLMLVQTAGSLSEGGDAAALQPLAKRYAEKQTSLDAGATDWLVGKALNTRRPQVGLVNIETNLYEAALPLMGASPGGPRVIGVLDLLAVRRARDSHLGPFSIRSVAEMQAAATVLAISLSGLSWLGGANGAEAGETREGQPNAMLSDGGDMLPPLSRPSSLRIDLQSLYTFSGKIAQSKTREQVLQALVQAMRSVPYASAILVPPVEATAGQTIETRRMEVVIGRQLRKQPPGVVEPPLVLPTPLLHATEEFFTLNQGHPFLLFDLDRPVERPAESDARPSDAPPELEIIAQRLGARSAAFIPALRDGNLAAILLMGSPPEISTPVIRVDMLEPFSNLVNLTAAALERIQSQFVIQRKLAEMATLWQFTKAVSIETNFNSLLRLLHLQIEHVMGALNSFAVGLFEVETNTIHIPYMVEGGKQLSVPPFPLGEGLSSAVIHSQQPLLFSTAEEVQAQSALLGAKQIGDPAKSWLGVPMLYAGEVLGLIIVQDTQRDGRFDNEDAQLLSTLASQVAVVVHNVRLLESSRRQAQQERLVNEISDRIRHAADMQTILKTTADELGRALGARRAKIRIGRMAESPDTPQMETGDGADLEAQGAHVAETEDGPTLKAQSAQAPESGDGKISKAPIRPENGNGRQAVEQEGQA